MYYLVCAVQGAIVNVSSIAVIVPILSFPQYCAAKAGMDALTKNLALKLAPQGVRVNSVLPGERALQCLL